MLAFFETYKSDIIYSVLVLLIVACAIIVTILLHKWLAKKKEQRFPGQSTSSLLLIRRILNALWLVLGVIAISSLFAEEQGLGAIKKYFRIALYLGSLAVVTIVATSTANLWFKKRIREKTEKQQDATNYKFLRYVVVVAISFTGIVFGLLVFPSLKGVAQTALGGVGVITLIIGVASQEALANLVGGVFIISFKPFKVGDIIKITDTMWGTVTDITLRHTVIRDFGNKMIVIPNSVINKEKLINFDLGESKICERLDIGISYDSNVKVAKKIIQEECENHPFIVDNRTAAEKKNGLPVVKTALISYDDSSVTIRAWAWSSNFEKSYQLRCDVLESIKERFDQQDIEIPYPYRTVVMRPEKTKKAD